MAKRSLKVVEVAEEIKLDLGCGKNKKEGFIGVDQRKFDGVDVVLNLIKDKWPWKSGSVSEIHMSHALEHFTGPERVKIFNEMYRVMRTGATALITTPYYGSERAYGDFTHKWPPVAGFLYYYLSKEWRAENAPDNDIQWNPDGYNCDFACTWGFSMHPTFIPKNQEAQQFALQHNLNAAQDIICTMVKK